MKNYYYIKLVLWGLCSSVMCVQLNAASKEVSRENTDRALQECVVKNNQTEATSVEMPSNKPLEKQSLKQLRYLYLKALVFNGARCKGRELGLWSGMLDTKLIRLGEWDGNAPETELSFLIMRNFDVLLSSEEIRRMGRSRTATSVSRYDVTHNDIASRVYWLVQHKED